MEINMKGYNLESFKNKDIYTWDEIIGIIEELESENYNLKEELKNLQQDMEDNFKRVNKEEQIF